MGAYLILGLAGAGKTSLVKELRHRGKLAVDIDDMSINPPLANWIDEHGRSAAYQNDPTWRVHHQFLWSLPAISLFLASHQPGETIYLAGIGANALAAVSLFDKVMFLDAPADAIFKRLSSPSRKTPYPFECTEQHKKWVCTLVPLFKQDMLKVGARRIDAKASILQIANNVIEHCEC